MPGSSRAVSQPAPRHRRAGDAGDMAFVPTAGPGVRAILAADPSVRRRPLPRRREGGLPADPRSLLEGRPRGASGHVDDHVYETFAGAVEQREKDGLKLDNRLVAIDQAVISEAALERGVAVLTVRFEADIAAVTRNAEGEVVAGSLSDAVQTRDLWTFRRDTRSRDPNWLLIETDEEE